MVTNVSWLIIPLPVVGVGGHEVLVVARLYVHVIPVSLLDVLHVGQLLLLLLVMQHFLLVLALSWGT